MGPLPGRHRRPATFERNFADFHDVVIDEEGPFGLEGTLKHWHYYFVYFVLACR